MEIQINKSNNNEYIEIAVVGAHLKGMPLNYQLTQLDASFLYKTKTAKKYKLYKLKDEEVLKPGLLKTIIGYAIELEVWRMPIKNLGYFEKFVLSPLVIGNIEIEDGNEVKGFLCEHFATIEAEDISMYGGWKAYLKSINK